MTTPTPLRRIGRCITLRHSVVDYLLASGRTMAVSSIARQGPEHLLRVLPRRVRRCNSRRLYKVRRVTQSVSISIS
jgi:hypothetical protein